MLPQLLRHYGKEYIMAIIEKIYSGTLFPCEQTNEYKARINAAHKAVCDAEDALTGQFPEASELTDDLLKAHIHLASESDLGEYVKGFRHGALLMLDILRGES